jgi:hypothetical protein
MFSDHDISGLASDSAKQLLQTLAMLASEHLSFYVKAGSEGVVTART